MKKNSLSTETLFALAGLAAMPEIEFHNYRQGPIGATIVPIGAQSARATARDDLQGRLELLWGGE